MAIVRFTRELSRWEPETFVETVLIDWLRVAEVWVGENFLFGRERTGTFTLLRALGEDRGFRTEKIEPVRYKDFVVSSTRVRHLVAEGRVDEAGALLGHHYAIDGTVVYGDGAGPRARRSHGQPGVGQSPAPGVRHLCVDRHGGRRHYPAVTSVGVRPTIGDNRLTVETHLLDRSLDLYGAKMRVSFVKWLREERRFDSLEALKTQMAADCDEARNVFARITV